ncbi:GerAB/ArcD/ProY family transporter [Bacillus benzoevorans]|uniref:Spore germination protein (Amino acid permease) n=1 Tax=Bacillus benzoevorans TaxID=1456 RepID=A0A7X0LX56_9BACI|nr:endospore germination permease [Bacillus benzoevorans]MBB6447821.1 spore germination protein (amino acid permease) [Bacillus benzoevorans]
MKQQPGKLGIREYASIAILMVASKASEDTPAVLYSHVKNAAWIIPLLAGVIFFVPFYLLVKTFSVHQNKTLFELIQNLFGKYIGFFIGMAIFLINSVAISFDSRTYANIIRTYYFTTTPNLIIYAILMLVCAYGAKKGIQHIGSVSYIVIFYVILSFYVALLLSAQDANISAIFPIWGTGIADILKESIPRVTLYADFFILTAILPYVTSFKDFKKSTWIAYFYVIFHLSIAVLVFICLFDVTMTGMGYPFHTAIRYISFGRFLSNIEILFLPIWLMATFIRFSAFLYINAHMFGHLFKIKDFQYLIPSLAAIYLLIGMIPESALDLSVQFKGKVKYFAGPIYAALCILLWATALFKGEFKHAKKKNSM